ncbi:uncharacterized protein MONBRDRAFT_21653 [Monosiga brevicollis MX1]|uniref:Kinesin motor domain-containing protein n=1 Tax=Monosiga brevicollis TaxID=81824 RepID=A9V6W0_MONBE|nr:uncharacterized protein MONBRDRAFT_21653 [Monosiga brevicollis MX1]EDQ86613.1 predicted protein [Monosiga brevicollis MX1]|eukprot:XP_001748449.1 hypothetical protein [Monosiga brevicollis MX1]
MPDPTGTGEDENVQVAVRVRPLSADELTKGCKPVVHKSPDAPHISLRDHHQFTFDQVFPPHTHQSDVFTECVKPLVDGVVNGRNATVLAYGQTGSGKTYTMGTGYGQGTLENQGMLPRATRYLFDYIARAKNDALLQGIPEPEFRIEVSFIELYNNSFYDLFDASSVDKKKSKIKVVGDASRGVTVQGVVQFAVSSPSEIMALLDRGSLARVTESTNMNQFSSRSHAIFSLEVSHRRAVVPEV